MVRSTKYKKFTRKSFKKTLKVNQIENNINKIKKILNLHKKAVSTLAASTIAIGTLLYKYKRHEKYNKK